MTGSLLVLGKKDYHNNHNISNNQLDQYIGLLLY